MQRRACFGAPVRSAGLVALAVATLAGCAGAARVTTAPTASAGAARSTINAHAQLARSAVMLAVLSEVFDGDATSSTESTGSGFVVELAGERIIATAAHVIADATEIEVRHASGFRTQVTHVLAIDREADIALLRVAELPAEAVAVPLREAKLDIADKVALISSPLGFSATLSFGTVAAFRPELRAYQLAAGVSPGSSGGLVADEDGRVIGVIVAKAPSRVGGENITLVTPARYLTQLFTQSSPQRLAPSPEPKRMVTIRRHTVVTAASSPFDDRPAAARVGLRTGTSEVSHVCASVSDPNATVALGEAGRPVGKVSWRVSRHRSCASFPANTPFSIWIGDDRAGKTLVVTVERQK